MKRPGRIIFGVLLLVMLIPAALLLVIATEQGSRSLLRQVERLLPLEIDYGSGNLIGRLHLESLRYTPEGLRLELHDVVAELDPDCLWRGALCFRQLQVGGIDIGVLPAAETEQTLQADTPEELIAQLIHVPLLLEAPSLAINSLRVHWPGGEWRQGALQASVRLLHANIDVLRARIVEPQLMLLATDETEDATSGSTVLPVIDLPLILSVYDLQLIKPAWDFYGARYQQDKISLRGQWQHNVLQLDRLRVDSSDLGALSLNGELNFSGNWPLDVAAAIDLAAPLQYSDLLGTTVQLSARGDLSALALQLNYVGTVDVAVEAQANMLDAGLPFSTTLTAISDSSVTLADIVAVPAVLQGTEVEFPLVITASGSLHAQYFEVSGAASGLGYQSLRLAALGQHEQDKVVISELLLSDASGNNELRAQGEILLSSEHTWSLVLQSSGLNVPSLSESVRGRVDGSVQLAGDLQDDRWQLRIEDVALQGQINDMPATIRGFAGVDSELRLSASALLAQLNGAQLLVESPGDEVGPGQLHLQVDDLGRWQAGSSGQLEVDAQVSSNREHIQLSASLQHILWFGLRIQQAVILGDYKPNAEHAFRLDSTMSDVAVGDLTLADLQLSARGDDYQQALALVSRGDIQGEINVKGTAQGEQWQGSLAPTRVQTSLGELVLAEAVAMQFSRAQEQFTLAAHCWRHEYLQLCPGNWVLGPAGGGSLEVHADLEILSDLLPFDVDLTGEAQLQLDTNWAPDMPIRVTGNAQTGAITITQHFEEGESATFGWDAADVGLAYTNEGLRLKVDLQRDSHRLVGVELLLPPDRNDAIAGSISVNRLRLGALTHFVPALSTLAGDLSGDVSLSGTVDSPQGFGQFTLTGGHLAVAGNSTQLADVDLSFGLQGRSAQIRGKGVLGGGELQLVGRVDADPELRMELNITGHEHNIFYPPSIELQVSETLQVVLQKDLLELKGELTVLDGVLEIEELPEGGVALSPSIVEVDADGAVLHEQLPFDVRINVQIHIEDRFTVTATNLQTKLGGDLRVRQRPGQPLQVFGNLDAVSGEFRAYQTRLQIKRGTLNFTGPPINPTVDVRAERHISSGDVTVGVHVQGPLQEDLLLNVYSQPSMVQADAMSYLVRGRGMDAGAGLDGTSLALAMASGLVNRSDLVTELNRIPGLSNVEFGAQGSDANTAATVSGYLGERLYLSYGVGLYEPVNVLTTRFYFRSRLWLEVVSSIENSVDLYYSFDID